MFIKLSLITSLLVSASISFAGISDNNLSCSNLDLTNSKEISKRINYLKLATKYREDTLNIRKEIATDAMRTSGMAKLGWTLGALPLSFTLGAAGGVAAVEGALNGTATAVATSTVLGAAILSPIVYVNYKLGVNGAQELILPDLDAEGMVHLSNHAEDTLRTGSDLSVSPTCYFNLIRMELASVENSVFENELNGSLKNTIKDHLLAGTVAVKGTVKLYQATLLNQLVDQAEMKYLEEQM